MDTYDIRYAAVIVLYDNRLLPYKGDLYDRTFNSARITVGVGVGIGSIYIYASILINYYMKIFSFSV